MAESIEGALALDSTAVDVVTLDLSLPGVGGLEGIERIRTKWPQARILVLTVHPEDTHAAACAQHGAAGFLSKNASPTEIRTAVAGLAAGGQARDRAYFVQQWEAANLPQAQGLPAKVFLQSRAVLLPPSPTPATDVYITLQHPEPTEKNCAVSFFARAACLACYALHARPSLSHTLPTLTRPTRLRTTPCTQ
jgi:hypothetical protein